LLIKSPNKFETNSKKTRSRINSRITSRRPAKKPVSRSSRRKTENNFHRLQKRIGLFVVPDRNSDIIPHFGILKPPHQDFSLSKFFQPFFSGKLRRTRQYEIRLAGQHIEPGLFQGGREAFSRSDHSPKIFTIIL